MGQKEKLIKSATVGLLTQKFMNDVLDEIAGVEDPKGIMFLKENFKAIVIQRVNTVLDFLDKRRLTAEEFEELEKATELAQEGYSRYLAAKELKKKEKEERKNRGEQGQLTPV